MRKILLCLLVVAALVLPVGCAGSADARPVDVRWVADHSPVRVGEVTTYTGSGVCDTATCRPQFRLFGPGYSRTGTTVAEGYVFTTTWTKPGNYLLQFRLTNSNGTNGYTTFDAYSTVTP